MRWLKKAGRICGVHGKVWSAAAVLTLVTACGGGDPAPTGDPGGGALEGGGESVWTVDLVRTLPGMQDEYLRSIAANWAGARELARERGAVLSYLALATEPDSARGWNVMLMTEYADSAAYEDREAIFQEIFASPEFVRQPTSRPSGELRTFTVGGVVLREVLDVTDR